MLNRILSTIIFAVVCVAAVAQEKCTINGCIADTRMGDGKIVKKVQLVSCGEEGQGTVVAEAKVKKGKYTLEYTLAQGEPALLYRITGFNGDGAIELFVEPGVVTVTTASAARPQESCVGGTPTNDTYSEYKALMNSRKNELDKQLAALQESNGAQWLETAGGKAAVKRLEAREAVKTYGLMLRFFIDHNASAMTPLEVERSLLDKLTPAYAEQVTNAVSTLLHTHPYYLSLRNKMLAGNMKVGNEVPDVALPLLSGETRHLSDYRGKYVVLNFWAADCKKSDNMLAELQYLHKMLQDNPGQFVVVSFALVGDAAVWNDAINSKGVNLEGWLHASDCQGAASPVAKLFGVEKTPRIVLVEPEGRAVSLDMEIDEVVMRVEQILSGDLYYLDKKE
ncbi:MAG: AhpC/TSA family protein [Bacteroidaceae bacterium]|nr:AhpC/TSA family protein [Bacteroidaceae bacterium]